MNTSVPAIRLRNIVEFGDTSEQGEALLDRLSLDVPRPASIGILGGPRSGKSTLARLMAGHVRPTRGTIEINGNISWAANMPLRPLPSLKLRDYVHFVARMNSADPDHVMHNVITMCGFPEDHDPIAGDLDKNDKAKLQLALKFAFDFDCYILDEPSFSTDPIFRLMAETVIERMSRRRSIVFLSKSERILRRFCDVTYRLEKGQLVLAAPAAPSTEAVQDDLE